MYIHSVIVDRVGFFGVEKERERERFVMEKLLRTCYKIYTTIVVLL